MSNLLSYTIDLSLLQSILKALTQFLALLYSLSSPPQDLLLLTLSCIFVQELRNETGIDLENIVYYKDDTHYFVMTAKKDSLREKGVLLAVSCTCSTCSNYFTVVCSTMLYSRRHLKAIPGLRLSHCS